MASPRAWSVWAEGNISSTPPLSAAEGKVVEEEEPGDRTPYLFYCNSITDSTFNNPASSLVSLLKDLANSLLQFGLRQLCFPKTC